MNVEVAVVVPAAAVNVTLTPVFQFEVVSCTLVGACVITVLPVRAIATVTVPAGAALSRTDDVPLSPPAIDSVLGVKLIVGVGAVPIVNAPPPPRSGLRTAVVERGGLRGVRCPPQVPSP